MPKGFKDYIAAAKEVVGEVDAEAARALHHSADVAFIDVREPTELSAQGKIAGATAVPRGVLEFQIDPTSGAHNRVFSSGQKLIFYCASGGRSLLAAQVAKEMGIEDSVSLAGGYGAWLQMDGPVESVD